MRIAPARRALLIALAITPLLVFAYYAFTLALVDSQLGYDESVYALGARGWVTGIGLDHYPPYRPVGMRLLAAPGWLAGGTPADFRVFAALYATGCMAVVWGLGRRVVGGAAAAVAIAVFATSLEIQLRSAELLSDLPSLALIFAVVWIVVRELEREGGPGWPFVLAGPLAAASFFVRYGSTLILVSVAVAAVALYFPVVRRHWRLAAITAGVFALCMVLHLLHSRDLTGSALGVMRSANRAAGRRYYGEGLWFLYRHFPDKPGGLILAIVAFVGFGSGLMHLIRLRTDALHRRIGFIWLAATLHTLAVGLDAHGESRFVFFGAFLYTLLGAHAFVRLLDGAPRRRIYEVAIPAAVALWLIARDSHRDAIRHNQRDQRSGVVLLAAASAVVDDAGGEPCAVASPVVPQMTWLTGCAPYSISMPLVLTSLRESGLAHQYVVLFSDADRTPKGDGMAEVMAEVEQPPIAEIHDDGGSLGDAVVYRLKR